MLSKAGVSSWDLGLSLKAGTEGQLFQRALGFGSGIGSGSKEESLMKCNN